MSSSFIWRSRTWRRGFGTKVLLKGFGNSIRNASLRNRKLFYDGFVKSTIKSTPKNS